MTDCEPQCQFFVVRKKRLCRMTVKPGRCYCGEHEPQPIAQDGQTDPRVPCPNDPKHTCYASKLDKHLLICNARLDETLPYIVPNINAPAADNECERCPLSKISLDTLIAVINKVNALYDKYLHGNILSVPEQDIHPTVLGDFTDTTRTESSLRHLRQASSLLRLAESEGLVQGDTCYVELGAGRGQLSYYLGTAWCGAASSGGSVLAVDRAAPRHKRDNRLRAQAHAHAHAQPHAHARLRADLAHLELRRVPCVERCGAVVGFAKHLCGVATDYALRCLTGRVLPKTRGAVLATCCHHRCARAGYVANSQLQDLGISGQDLNVMLGIVSWATCGDGRSRERRRGHQTADHEDHDQDGSVEEDRFGSKDRLKSSQKDQEGHEECQENGDISDIDHSVSAKEQDSTKSATLTQKYKEEVGRKAKALLDWGRVLYLRGCGFDARLCYFVPVAVSLENLCIVAKKITSCS